MTQATRLAGQMQWRRHSSGALELYVSDSTGFRHYKSSPLAQPDYRVPNGTKGWATYQHLLKLGYELLPTPQVDEPDDTEQTFVG